MNCCYRNCETEATWNVWHRNSDVPSRLCDDHMKHYTSDEGKEQFAQCHTPIVSITSIIRKAN